jgi:hypothetical protein
MFWHSRGLDASLRGEQALRAAVGALGALRADRGKNHDPSATITRPDLRLAPCSITSRPLRAAMRGPAARLDPICARRVQRAWAGTKSGALSRTKADFLACKFLSDLKKRALQPNQGTGRRLSEACGSAVAAGVACLRLCQARQRTLAQGLASSIAECFTDEFGQTPAGGKL